MPTDRCLVKSLTRAPFFEIFQNPCWFLSQLSEILKTIDIFCKQTKGCVDEGESTVGFLKQPIHEVRRRIQYCSTEGATTLIHILGISKKAKHTYCIDD